MASRNAPSARSDEIILCDCVSDAPEHESYILPQALFLRLQSSLIRSLESIAREGKAAHFLFGNNPVLKHGGTTTHLKVSPTHGCHELYETTETAGKLQLAAFVTHDVQLQELARQSAAAEAASQRLKEQLDAQKRERDSNKAAFIDSVRLSKASRTNTGAVRNTNSAQSSSIRPSGSLTSPLPASSSQGAGQAARTQAQRFSILHLLAVQPRTLNEILDKTHIPREECTRILDKTAESADGRWQLKRKLFRELDVWRFAYTSDSDRESAVQNAITAFDRDRLDPSDPIRQQLLPKHERGKGKNLSNLHLDTSRKPVEQPRKKNGLPAVSSGRVTSDHRKVLQGSGGPQSKQSSPGTPASLKPKSAVSGAASVHPATAPAASPAVTARRKQDKETVAKQSVSSTRSTQTTKDSQPSKDVKAKSVEEDRLNKKRKSQVIPKSKEIIHDSDEELREAEATSSPRKKPRLAQERKIQQSSAKEKPGSGLTPRPTNKPEVVPKPLPTIRDKGSTTSRSSTTSSISASSPLTPLGTSPESVEATQLQRRYEAAFAKHMEARFSNEDVNATSHFEQVARELADLRNITVEDLYIPAGPHLFPDEALETFAGYYNNMFPSYARARESYKSARDREASKQALDEANLLQRQLRYYKALWEAAARSKQLEQSS